MKPWIENCPYKREQSEATQSDPCHALQKQLAYKCNILGGICVRRGYLLGNLQSGFHAVRIWDSIRCEDFGREVAGYLP